MDSQKISSDAPCQRGASRIKQILAHDRRLAVAKRFEHADLRALFLHHAVHGRHADQRRHQKEEDRKNIGEPLHNAGVVLKTGIADIGIPVKDVRVRRFDRGDIRLRLRDLPLCIGDLVLKLRIGIVVLRPAVRDLRLRVQQLLPVLRDLRLRIGKLPAPDAPTITQNSLFSIWKFTSCSAWIDTSPVL